MGMPSLHIVGATCGCRDGTPVPSASTKGNVACSLAGCHTTPNPSYLRRGAVAASQPYIVGATCGCVGTAPLCRPPRGCRTGPKRNYTRSGRTAWECRPYTLWGQRVAVGTAPLCRPPRQKVMSLAALPVVIPPPTPPILGGELWLRRSPTLWGQRVAV